MNTKASIFFASMIIAISMSAQTNQTWSIKISKLIHDNDSLEVALTSTTGKRTVTVQVNSDERTITYDKNESGLPGLPLTIDLSNQHEKQSLISLLESYEKNAAGQSLYFIYSSDAHSESFKEAIKQYQGVLGNCSWILTHSYNGDAGSGPDQPLYFISDNNKELVLPEPTALLYAINHHPDFLQLRTAAVKKKAETEIATQQAEELKKQKEQEDQETEKKQVEAAEQRELAKKTKTLAFMDSDEGQALLKKIRSQWTVKNDQYKKEAADIIELQKTLNQLVKDVTDFSLPANVREAANQEVSDKHLQLEVAKNQFKPSDKLNKMTTDLKASFDEFESKAGVSYDDAMKYRKLQ